MKNRLKTNILIDIGLLLAMTTVSFSGFVMNVIVPSRHASVIPEFMLIHRDFSAWAA